MEVNERAKAAKVDDLRKESARRAREQNQAERLARLQAEVATKKRDAQAASEVERLRVAAELRAREADLAAGKQRLPQEEAARRRDAQAAADVERLRREAEIRALEKRVSEERERFGSPPYLSLSLSPSLSPLLPLSARSIPHAFHRPIGCRCTHTHTLVIRVVHTSHAAPRTISRSAHEERDAIVPIAKIDELKHKAARKSRESDQAERLARLQAEVATKKRDAQAASEVERLRVAAELRAIEADLAAVTVSADVESLSFGAGRTKLSRASANHKLDARGHEVLLAELQVAQDEEIKRLRRLGGLFRAFIILSDIKDRG